MRLILEEQDNNVNEDVKELKYSEEEIKTLRRKTLARRKNLAPNASEKNIPSNLYSKQSYQNYGHDGSNAMSSQSTAVGSPASSPASSAGGNTSGTTA